MTDFPFKTKPFDHQLKIFEERRHLETDCLFLEQGTGKTKCVLDLAADLYLDGKINALLIVAPPGVQRNWVTDEIPAHLIDSVAQGASLFCWSSQKASTQRHERATEALLKHRGLTVLAISYDAFMTKRGKDFVWKFLRDRKVLYVLDESTRIKTPGAKRTKSILASAKYAKHRRILTGTPATNRPFDVYTQIRFTHPDLWKKNGMGDFYAFKTFFGVFEKKMAFNATKGVNYEYDSLTGYQNLPILKRLLDQVSVRVLKDDVLDLPPKLYSKQYYEMTAEQKRLYAEIVTDFLGLLADGREVSAPLAITRLLRLQQTLCGYLPTHRLDDDGYLLPDLELVSLTEGNPRLDLLMEICEDTPHKAIIWARFQRDIDLILKGLADRKLIAVRYDSRVKEDERAENKARFRTGDAQFFVGNPQAGGTGLTLSEAKTVIYYNNTFDLDTRLQSEDRAHRAGLKHPVQYIDLIAEDTIDIYILEQLRNKIDIASTITGDKLKQWVL